MKKSFIVLIVFVLFLFTNSSFAGNVYVSGSAGLTILEDATSTDIFNNDIVKFDNGWNIGGAIGYDFGVFRTELEVAYRNNNLDSVQVLNIDLPFSGSFSSTSFLVNGLIDIENKSSFTPYFGVGIGFAKLYVNDTKNEITNIISVNDSTTVFAYKLTTGSAFKMSENIDITLDYAFLGTTEPGFETVNGFKFKSEYHSHNINAGIRYYF